jgi:hypothetical protein
VAPHIEQGRGAAIAPAPPGLITLAAGPESAAAAPASLWPRGGNKCPAAREALEKGEPARAAGRVDVDALIAAWLEIDQEREVFSLAAKKKLRKS